MTFRVNFAKEALAFREGHIYQVPDFNVFRRYWREGGRFVEIVLVYDARLFYEGEELPLFFQEPAWARGLSWEPAFRLLFLGRFVLLALLLLLLLFLLLRLCFCF